MLSRNSIKPLSLYLLDTLYVITSGVISIQSNMCTKYNANKNDFYFQRGLLNVRIIKCKLIQQWFLWSM